MVSELCLGTMTFGSQNSEAESFALMDRAFEAGINFLDTAELYPVPPRKEWVHRTEEIVGKWLKTKDREQVIIATKVAGPGHGWFRPPVRHGMTALDRVQLRKALQGSLERLDTDYVDLYQTHWPDHDFGYEETLEALDELVREGLVRIVGSSNETAWGMMKAEATAQARGLCRYQTVQNNFSICNRRFEDAMADIARREKISLLPYSPLGGGVCTGKYNGPSFPVGARFSEYLQSGGDRQKMMAQRFVNEKSLATVAELAKLAEQSGLSLALLALAWCKQQDFVASTIFGATTLEQLEENLKAVEITLTPEQLKEVDRITSLFPYPMG